MAFLNALLAYILIEFSTAAAFVPDTSFYFDKIESCVDKSGATMNFTDIQIVNLGRGQTAITGVMTIHEDVGTPQTAILTIEKCQARQEPCEYFGTYKAGSICDKVVAKGYFWTPFFAAFTPPLKCPFQQGEYKIENATLDASILMNMPGIPGHYWTLRLQLLVDNKVVSCTDMEGELHHNPPQSMRVG